MCMVLHARDLPVVAKLISDSRVTRDIHIYSTIYISSHLEEVPHANVAMGLHWTPKRLIYEIEASKETCNPN
jgi:hypothetical protein